MSSDSDGRPVYAAGDGWRSYGGFRFKEVGLARFEFQSRSKPGQSYVVDLHEAPYCSCWPSTRNATRTAPRLCCHTLVLKKYLGKLRDVMNSHPPTQI